MKRLMMTTLLMLAMTLGLQAQILNGTWKADKEFASTINSFMEDENTKGSFYLVFNGVRLDIKMRIISQEDGMGIKLVFTIPGTFVRTGNRCKATFNVDKTSVKLEQLTSTDPDIKQMLADPEMKKMLFNIVEQSMNDQMKGEVDFQELASLFNQFDIVSVTTQKLTLSCTNGTKLGFDRSK